MRLPLPLAAAGARTCARVGAATWRFRPADGGDATVPLVDGRLRPAVYALWHEHLLPLAVLHSGFGAAALASRHRDGEILARVLGSLGYRPVRGSSSRGGAAGLREMIREGRRGRPLAFTPDGPRGPARRPKPGAVLAAAATRLPIVPVAAAASRGWRLGSWDRFLVPAPFATVFVSHGAPLAVPAPGEALDVSAWCERLGRALERETRRCEARAGGGGG